MLLFVDSCSYYTDYLLRWTYYKDAAPAGSISVGSGRYSGNALYSNGGYFGGSQFNYHGLGASYGTLIAGVAVKLTNVIDTQAAAGRARILSFWDAGLAAEQCYVTTDSSGHLALYQGTNLLGTGPTPLQSNVYCYVECRVAFASGTGSATVRLNGVTEIVVSGVTTISNGTASAAIILMGGGGQCNTYHCDMYVCDTSGSQNNSFLGDCRVECLLPSGAGAETQWAPLSGSNYANVNEVPANGDTTYNKSNTVGQTDTYAMPDLAAATGLIYGVQYIEDARKDNAGTRLIAPVVRIGGADYPGANVGLGGSYAYSREIKELSPATSAAWTISEINAMEYGIKVTA